MNYYNISKPLPQNIEAEEAVLGSVLVKGEIIKQVLNILTNGDFYKEAHRKIFDAMIAMNQEDKPIDLLTVFDYLKQHEKLLEDVGGSSYLAYLTEIVPTTANVKYYAKLVKEKSNLRNICERNAKVIQAIQSGKREWEIISLFQESMNFESYNPLILKPVSAKDLGNCEPVETLW